MRKIARGQSNSKTVVNLTKQIFSEHGVPQIVRSDNGPHFQGHYPEFAKEYGFQHVTNSPHYPRSTAWVCGEPGQVCETNTEKGKEISH